MYSEKNADSSVENRRRARPRSLTDDEADGDVVREPNAIADRRQIGPLDEPRHLLDERPTHTKASAASGKPKLPRAALADHIAALLKVRQRMQLN